MHTYCLDFVDACLYLDWKGNQQNSENDKDE